MQGARNCMYNIQMYTNKLGMYAKFLEAIGQGLGLRLEMRLNANRNPNPNLRGSRYKSAIVPFLHWLKIILYFCLSQSLDMNVQTMFNCSTNVTTVLIKFTLSTFLMLLYNLRFVEHVNELMHVQMHLTSFTEFRVILN